MTDTYELTDEDRATRYLNDDDSWSDGMTLGEMGDFFKRILRTRTAELGDLREEVDTQTAAHGTELGKKDAELERLEKEMSQRTHHRDKMTFHWWKLSQEAVAWLRTAREYMDDGPMSEIDAFLAKLDGDQGETFAGCPVIREIEPLAPEMVKMMEEEGETESEGEQDVMYFNASAQQVPDYAVEVNNEDPRAILWSLLDDIDTASDMFKPEQTNFYRYVMKKAEERFKILQSDGYKLYEVFKYVEMDKTESEESHNELPETALPTVEEIQRAEGAGGKDSDTVDTTDGETQHDAPAPAPDFVYTERSQLIAALSKLFPAHLYYDHNGEDGYRKVVSIHLPTGQVTWHVADEDLGYFEHLESGLQDWDGHNTEEKYRRLNALKGAGENGGDTADALPSGIGTDVSTPSPAPDLALPWKVKGRDNQWSVVVDINDMAACRPPSTFHADAIVEAVNGWWTPGNDGDTWGSYYRETEMTPAQVADNQRKVITQLRQRVKTLEAEVDALKHLNDEAVRQYAELEADNTAMRQRHLRRITNLEAERDELLEKLKTERQYNPAYVEELVAERKRLRTALHQAYTLAHDEAATDTEKVLRIVDLIEGGVDEDNLPAIIKGADDGQLEEGTDRRVEGQGTVAGDWTVGNACLDGQSDSAAAAGPAPLTPLALDRLPYDYTRTVIADITTRNAAKIEAEFARVWAALALRERRP